MACLDSGEPGRIGELMNICRDIFLLPILASSRTMLSFELLKTNIKNVGKIDRHVMQPKPQTRFLVP
jgi:hypothetical protein